MSSNSDAMKQWRIDHPNYMHDWYIKNQERLLVSGRNWREENKERMDFLNKRNYRINGDAIRALARDWSGSHQEAVKAHSQVKLMIKNGKLEKAVVCSTCDNGGRVEAHHEDYSKPLDVVWLCHTCHKREHAKVLV